MSDAYQLAAKLLDIYDEGYDHTTDLRTLLANAIITAEARGMKLAVEICRGECDMGAPSTWVAEICARKIQTAIDELEK